MRPGLMRCVRCLSQWYDRPGFYRSIDECPKCLSVYWIWVTYQPK